MAMATNGGREPAWCLLAKFHEARSFSTEVAGSCNFVRGGGDILGSAVLVYNLTRSLTIRFNGSFRVSTAYMD